MAQTVVGLFSSFEAAREVQAVLVHDGYKRDDVALIAANEEDRYAGFVERTLDEKTQAVTDQQALAGDTADAVRSGVLTGGLFGGIGAVVVAIFVPGVGPFTVTGWLLTGIVGLVSGALTGGILGALLDAGIDDAHAPLYAEGIRRGYVLALVRATPGDAHHIGTIMQQYGALDIDARAEYWRASGWNGAFDEHAALFRAGEVEDELVRYRSYAEHRQSDAAACPSAENKDVGAYAQAAPERKPQMVPQPDPAFSNVEYNAHYQTTYAHSGRQYDYYAPHYRYGYELATDPAYAGLEWETLEPEVRKQWEARNGSGDTLWDDVKEAVYSSWLSARRALS